MKAVRPWGNSEPQLRDLKCVSKISSIGASHLIEKYNLTTLMGRVSYNRRESGDDIEWITPTLAMKKLALGNNVTDRRRKYPKKHQYLLFSITESEMYSFGTRERLQSGQKFGRIGPGLLVITTSEVM